MGFSMQYFNTTTELQKQIIRKSKQHCLGKISPFLLMDSLYRVNNWLLNDHIDFLTSEKNSNNE